MDKGVADQKNKRRTIVWQLVVMAIFPFMITLGFMMRMNQAEIINTPSFYALMTLHGMGMVGILLSGAYAALWFLLSKEFNLSRTVNGIVLFLIIISFAGFVIATLVGHFGAGWYILYPLPFMSKGAWQNWATGLTIVSLTGMGLAWLIGLLDLFISMASKYGLTNLLGWQYLRKKEPEITTRPIFMITTIMVVSGIMAMIAGGFMLMQYLFQYFEPSLTYNPLVEKNLTFFFGHTIANILIYMGAAWIYELMPRFTGRDWGMNKVVVYAWNATLFLMLFAFFHHMYMDFHQPRTLQYLGEIASYLSAVPSSVVTMIGFIVQLYRSKASTKWQITPLLFFLGTAGWAIGGVAAVLDSTIALNTVFHNTLWVPAHFHTYLLMGYVPFLLGFIYYLFKDESNPEKDRIGKSGVVAFVIGACGFLTMFYLGGLDSIPRRFSNYMGLDFGHLHSIGETLAHIAVYFIALVLIGLLTFYISLFKSLPQTWRNKAGVIENIK